MRSIKNIGFLLLLAFWFPACLGVATGLERRVESGRTLQFKQFSESQNFSVLRLQSIDRLSAPGLEKAPGSPADHSDVRSIAASREIGILLSQYSGWSSWYVGNLTSFPRAPSLFLQG